MKESPGKERRSTNLSCWQLRRRSTAPFDWQILALLVKLFLRISPQKYNAPTLASRSWTVFAVKIRLLNLIDKKVIATFTNVKAAEENIANKKDWASAMRGRAPSVLFCME